MGQFTSFCPLCGCEIHWFLDTDDQNCRNCNTTVPAQTIKDSLGEFMAYHQNVCQKNVKCSAIIRVGFVSEMKEKGLFPHFDPDKPSICNNRLQCDGIPSKKKCGWYEKTS